MHAIQGSLEKYELEGIKNSTPCPELLRTGALLDNNTS
jgi:hypothetical protein